MTAWALLAFVGCGRRLPSALSLDASTPVAEGPATGTDEATLLASMVRGDPLARRPRLPDPAVWSEVAWARPLLAVADAVTAVERGAGQPTDVLRGVEEAWPGTPAVALARGVALQRAEIALAQGDRRAMARAITDLGAVSSGAPTEPERALQWAGDGPQVGETALDLGARRVLAGWLSSPKIPVGSVADLLDAALYDRLYDAPIGQLLRARAAAGTADDAAAFADLARATSLALERAAADRDREQAAWAATRDAERAALGVTDGDPVALRLERAFEGLLPSAGVDRGAGGALLALTALRWDAACGQDHCRGLDRVDTMRLAGGWHPDVERLSSVWQVVAWTEALETLRVGHQTVLFDAAIVGMADVVLGTGGRLPVDLVEREVPDASTWLVLGRAMGVDGTVEPDACLRALGRALAERAEAAAAEAVDPADGERLRRIAARAAP